LFSPGFATAGLFQALQSWVKEWLVRASMLYGTEPLHLVIHEAVLVFSELDENK
jgi:hypothetical protein